mgnify:CR=1 FL=1
MAKRRADSNLAMFKPKDSARTRPAAMTAEGYAAFERARTRIRVVRGGPARVSDADTIEYVVRWFDDPQKLVKYLRAVGQWRDAGQETRTP